METLADDHATPVEDDQNSSDAEQQNDSLNDSSWSLCMDDSDNGSDTGGDYRPKRAETIKKDHWKKKKSTKECVGCGKIMNILQRKHHCRVCGEVFCYYCTRKTRRLTPDIVPDPDAKKYKVCSACFENICRDDSDQGQTRSRTIDFHTFWLEFKSTGPNQDRESVVTPINATENGTEIDSRGILRCMSIRAKLLDAFDNDMQKSTTDTMIERGKKAAKKGKIFRFFKKSKKKREVPSIENEATELEEPEISLCEDCRTNLNIDGRSRECMTCGRVFCDDCCEKSVQVSHFTRGRLSIQEPSIDVNCLRLQVDDTGQPSKRYRLCRFCRQEYLRECFLREVSSITQIMIQIQKEIMSSDDDDPEVPVLTQEYMQYYRKLLSLETHSLTQTKLKQNVQNAMREFHINRIAQRSLRHSEAQKCTKDEESAEDDARTILEADVHTCGNSVCKDVELIH